VQDVDGAAASRLVSMPEQLAHLDFNDFKRELDRLPADQCEALVLIGAVFGQLGGAYYGVAAIPRHWRQSLAQAELIAELADRLLRNALVQIGDSAAAS